MREYKFRGKIKDTEIWVYGYYYVDKDGHYIHLEKPGGLILIWSVISETIGQFTGQKDMDGKEIYEGDIVKWTVNNTSIGQVKFGLYEVCGTMFHGFFVDCKNFSLRLTERFKVIGNIHENPELIGGE